MNAHVRSPRSEILRQHFHRDVPEYIPDDRVSSSYDGGQFPEELARSPESRHSEEYFEYNRSRARREERAPVEHRSRPRMDHRYPREPSPMRFSPVPHVELEGESYRSSSERAASSANDDMERGSNAKDEEASSEDEVEKSRSDPNAQPDVKPSVPQKEEEDSVVEAAVVPKEPAPVTVPEIQPFPWDSTRDMRRAVAQSVRTMPERARAMSKFNVKPHVDRLVSHLRNQTPAPTLQAPMNAAAPKTNALVSRMISRWKSCAANDIQECIDGLNKLRVRSDVLVRDAHAQVDAVQQVVMSHMERSKILSESSRRDAFAIVQKRMSLVASYIRHDFQEALDALIEETLPMPTTNDERDSEDTEDIVNMIAQECDTDEIAKKTVDHINTIIQETVRTEFLRLQNNVLDK